MKLLSKDRLLSPRILNEVTCVLLFFFSREKDGVVSPFCVLLTAPLLLSFYCFEKENALTHRRTSAQHQNQEAGGGANGNGEFEILGKFSFTRLNCKNYNAAMRTIHRIRSG